MCVDVLPVCMSVPYVCLMSVEARRVSYRCCELPGGCWHWNPIPLQEQPVLLMLSHVFSSLTAFLKRMFTFVYVSVPEYMYVYHMCVSPTEVRRGHHIPWN